MRKNDANLCRSVCKIPNLVHGEVTVERISSHRHGGHRIAWSTKRLASTGQDDVAHIDEARTIVPQVMVGREEYSDRKLECV